MIVKDAGRLLLPLRPDRKDGARMVKAQYTRNENCVLLTLPEAVATFNLSASTIERLSRECGAKLKIGRAARYNSETLKEYISSFTVKAV